MRGAYIVVDHTGVALTENLSQRNKDKVKQGMSHEEYLKLNNFTDAQMKAFLGEEDMRVFKYLGYTHATGEIFNETVFTFAEEKQEESQDNLFTFVGNMLRRTLDTNYIVDWSD